MLYELHEHGNKAVVDTFGGELISFQNPDKTEYLWGGSPSSLEDMLVLHVLYMKMSFLKIILSIFLIKKFFIHLQ